MAADNAQQAAMELQRAQQRLRSLDQTLANLEQSMQELHTAISTVEGLTGDAPLSTQVPIGAGVRVAATVDPTQNILVDVGNGYAAEMTSSDAVTSLRDRLQRTESAFRTASADADQTAQRLQALQEQAYSSASS